MRFADRLRHAWDAFRNRDPTNIDVYNYGPASYYNPNQTFLHFGAEQTIIASIYNRISRDVAAIDIRHVRLNDNGRFDEIIDDSFNKCLSVSPNLDQTPRGFIQSIVLSMFDDGYVAVFPAQANLDPIQTGSYDIFELRKGAITEWYPEAVRIEAYNPSSGRIEQIIMPKDITAIIENPFYSIMNGPNSTLQRLIRKLALLDAVDEQSSSGKMDLIIQLPYIVRSEVTRQRAEERRKNIEMQLTGSKYGIAYIDGTERITQLNRSVENNLLAQVEYLQNMLYAQLGMSPSIFNGTATAEELTNYSNTTIEPIASAIVDEMKRKFLTKTARSQGQSIMFFRDPFKMIPALQVAETADKFIRNEILTANEFRGIIGYKPSGDPRADELRNPNISASNDERPTAPQKEVPTDDAPA